MGMFDFLRKAIKGEQEEEPQLNEFSVVIETTDNDQPRDTDPTRYAGSEFIDYDAQTGVPVFRHRNLS